MYKIQYLVFSLLPILATGASLYRRQEDFCTWGPPYPEGVLPEICAERNGTVICAGGQQYCLWLVLTGKGGMSLTPLGTRCSEEQFEQCLTTTAEVEKPTASPLEQY